MLITPLLTSTGEKEVPLHPVGEPLPAGGGVTVEMGAGGFVVVGVTVVLYIVTLPVGLVADGGLITIVPAVIAPLLLISIPVI